MMPVVQADSRRAGAASVTGGITGLAGDVQLNEIDEMRVDASFRALPDHRDRPDGPAPAIDNSLLAAARIQASINRQRWRPPEPAKPAPDRGLTWLASLTACVVAVAVLMALWDLGARAHAPALHLPATPDGMLVVGTTTDGKATDSTATDGAAADSRAGSGSMIDTELSRGAASNRDTPPAAAAAPVYDPAQWTPIGYDPTGQAALAAAAQAQAQAPAAAAAPATASIAPLAEASTYPPATQSRRPLYNRERPQPRRFSDANPPSTGQAASPSAASAVTPSMP